MASKDIQINGVQYTAVPSIEVTDKAGTGTVLFHEISDTTAAASDVLSGKYFYTSAGVKTQGSIVARTGDQPSDAQTAASSTVKLSVPDTAYYGDGANITATFAQVAATNIATSAAATGIMSPLTGGYIAKNRSVLGVAGTFSDSSTISSGQNAAAAAQLLTGYSAFIDGDELEGSMPNNGSTSGTISTKAGTVSIPAGYTTGGTVSIASTEQNKIIAGNIKDGVEILGVSGTFTDASTVSTGQTAAVAGDILTGKSAWVDGAEVKGSIAIGSNLTNLSQSGSIPNGYYSNKTYSVKTGSAAAPLTITDTSSALSSTDTGAPKITTSITPSVTAGWITSVSTSGTGDRWIKAGSATPAVTIGDTSSALSTSSTGGPTITLTPTASVGTAGWISSIGNGTNVTRYIKSGSASTSLSMSGGPTTSGSATSYTVSGIASIDGTTGWVSDFTSIDSDSVVIPNAGITSFDMVSGSTTTNKLTVELGHMVSSTPTDYVGYVNGGSATINYGTIANADIASVDGTAKNLQQVKNKILSDTTILGITGTCPTLSLDYVTDDISVDETNVYLSVPNTGYYSDDAAIYGKFSGTGSILAAWDTENGTSYNTNRTSSDLTKSGKTVTAPAGYYNASASLSVDDGSASATGAISTNVTGALSGSSTDGTPRISEAITPSVTPGWITSVSTTADSDKYIKKGSATPSVTVGDTSGALVTSSSGAGPTIELTPTASVGTAGWISSISNGTKLTRYVKGGSATPNATINSSSYLSTTATAYSFTVTPTASVGTSGWISSISNGSNVTGYIKAGSVSSYTANTTGTVSVAEGYVTATSFTVPTVTPETAGTGGSGGSGILTIA